MTHERRTPEVGESEETRAARKWLAEVYRGDRVPQLTVRAVLTGMLLGGVMALSNLYVGFKTGWGLGVTITACILAYALFSGLKVIVPSLRDKEFTILENNMMSSVASAAGYMSSSIFIGAVRRSISPYTRRSVGSSFPCGLVPCRRSASSWRSP